MNYSKPAVVVSYDVKELALTAAQGMVSTTWCWEEPDPTCGFPQ
jgi:hypothetical protein